MHNDICQEKKSRRVEFFVEIKVKPVHLICEDTLAVMKKANLEHHYSSKHAKLKNLKAQMRLDKIKVLHQSVMQTSFVVSKLIAKKLKPH